MASDLTKRQRELREWAKRHKTFCIALAGVLGAVAYFARAGSWWHSKATAYLGGFILAGAVLGPIYSKMIEQATNWIASTGRSQSWLLLTILPGALLIGITYYFFYFYLPGNLGLENWLTSLLVGFVISFALTISMFVMVYYSTGDLVTGLKGQKPARLWHVMFIIYLIPAMLFLKSLIEEAMKKL